MRLLDDFLNSITMYKTVLSGLLLLTTASFIASFMNVVPFSPLFLFLSLLVSITVCYITNFILAKIYKAPTNSESYFITALILFFIIPSPFGGFERLIPVGVAALLAMASKYIFNIKKKHLFNPAALASVLITFLGFGASWWIATPALIPATAIIGLLIIRKVRKFSLFFSFATVVLIEMVIFGFMFNLNPIDTLSQLNFSWPFLFFASVMLTEPLTMPPTRYLQILYGALVGFLFAFQMPLGPIQLSPELSLLAGNIFSYFVSSKQRIMLTLNKIEKLSETIYNFSFLPSEKLKFEAGQYVEWTLQHKKSDIRGNRRYFTIASSPTEKDIKLGVRVSEDGSSFKKALIHLKKDDAVSIGNLSGDFILPQNKDEKLVFLAGGIGITPFRSMVKYLLDKNEKRDIVLIHVCSSAKDFIYEDVFDKAKEEIGLKVIHILNEKENAPKDYKGLFGRITPEIIKQNVSDYKERKFYISGSNLMVDITKKTLFKLNISPTKIVTDYFSGY